MKIGWTSGLFSFPNVVLLIKGCKNMIGGYLCEINRYQVYNEGSVILLSLIYTQFRYYKFLYSFFFYLLLFYV